MYFGVLLSGCNSCGPCRDVQVLKEAGLIMRRSTWDFAGDETTFVIISDLCPNKNKTSFLWNG